MPLRHGNIAFQINALIEAKLVRGDDRVLLPLPLHHVYPFVIAMLAPVSMGIPIVMPQSLTGPNIVAAVRDSRATLMIGVPRLYDALNAGLEARLEGAGGLVAASVENAIGATTWLRRKAGLDLGRTVWRPLRKRMGPSLRVMVSGGAALDPALAWRLEGLGWTVATGYGLTETSPMLTWNLPHKGRLESAGRPVPGVEIRIDPAANPGEQPGGQPETGEILARGPNVFAGYRGLPDKTKEALTDDGWFRTGDLGYFDGDGFLHIVGRVSTMIVTEGGENVAPDTLEAAYGKHPAIAEIAVLQKDGRLVALIVPDLKAIEGTGREVVEEAVREAVQVRSRRLPSFMRLGGFRITREPIPRTRLGKPRRHLLGDLYERAGEEAPEARGAPVSPEDMAPEDRDLLADEPVRMTWEWLAERYPDRRLSPDSGLTLDLGIDSMDWVNLTLEIGQRTGIELGDEAIARIESVRDLLVEVARAAEKGSAFETASPFEEPEKVLSDRQKRWLRPLGPAAAAGAWVLHQIDRAPLRTAFRLRVAGTETLPSEAPCILAPNHGSYLDPFAVAAALDYARLRKTYWGGWTGAVFVNPVTRLVARLAQAVPIDAKRAVISSLAFAAAALKANRNLVWFPEGRRSQTGELQRFRTGLGMVLEHYPVPVVPVVIDGAHGALPPGRRWPRFRRISVTFGAPLDAEQLKSEGEGERDADRIVHALRQRLLEMREEASGQA